jgi:acyl-CoA synthetase (AMP-forming)/AMP-acid ligase II
MYYGLTEASRSTFNLYNENREKVESVGKATPNVEVMVVDDGMNELPANQTGEVIIRGRHVIDCYWKNKKETEKSIVNGWLKTGDMGYFDSEGYLWLVGRKDHIINVSGEKVAPREIEKVVSCSPGVKEAAAVGVPDEMFNEVVKVFVVKEGDATADDIIRFCRGKLESYKIPRFVEFVDSLPRTEAGKLRRGLLR